MKFNILNWFFSYKFNFEIQIIYLGYKIAKFQQRRQNVCIYKFIIINFQFLNSLIEYANWSYVVAQTKYDNEICTLKK